MWQSLSDLKTQRLLPTAQDGARTLGGDGRTVEGAVGGAAPPFPKTMRPHSKGGSEASIGYASTGMPDAWAYYTRHSRDSVNARSCEPRPYEAC